jgi:hypothetical protein
MLALGLHLTTYVAGSSNQKLGAGGQRDVLKSTLGKHKVGYDERCDARTVKHNAADMTQFATGELVERFYPYPLTFAQTLAVWGECQHDGLAPGVTDHMRNGTPTDHLIKVTEALCTLSVHPPAADAPFKASARPWVINIHEDKEEPVGPLLLNLDDLVELLRLVLAASVRPAKAGKDTDASAPPWSGLHQLLMWEVMGNAAQEGDSWVVTWMNKVDTPRSIDDKKLAPQNSAREVCLRLGRCASG